MKEDSLQIIQHYGYRNQLKKLNEECYELVEAVINAEHNRNIGVIRKPCQTAIDNITEEIADVLNMVEQFMYYYEIDIDDVIGIMHKKVHRQLERIENGEYDMEKYIKLETVSKEGIKHELKMKRIDEDFLIDYIVKINEVYNKLIDKVNEQDQIIREAREFVNLRLKECEEYNCCGMQPEYKEELIEILDRNVK
ncbi:MAG: hypothetical protein IJO32_00480 [Bacilli bacterium]|nr:hypothetical protein [Bacilli bacterium]